MTQGSKCSRVDLQEMARSIAHDIDEISASPADWHDFYTLLAEELKKCAKKRKKKEQDKKRSGMLKLLASSLNVQAMSLKPLADLDTSE